MLTVTVKNAIYIDHLNKKIIMVSLSMTRTFFGTTVVATKEKNNLILTN